MKLLSSLNTKQKQKLLMATIVAIMVSLVFLLVNHGNRVAPRKVVQTAPKKFAILSNKVDKDLWVAAQGANIKALQQSSQETQDQLKNLTNQITALQTAVKKNAAAKAKTPPKTTSVFPPLPAPLLAKGTHVKPLNAPTTFPPLPSSSAAHQPYPMTTSHLHYTGHQPAPESPIREFQDDSLSKKQTGKSATQKSKKESFFLPPSFMKVTLLNGLDAPTAGTARAEPYPVMMAVTGLSTLPNLYKMNLRDCFIIGAGFGNISDERAYIRTESLSCVRKDGGVLDVPLKGEVIGEDGKLGMRGRLVSRQGQQIAMALLSGLLSGFGQALRPQQSIALDLNPNGTVQSNTVPLSTTLEGATTTGVGSAMNKVANFYLAMAKRIYPVVQVDAGRHVEVMVLEGQTLDISKKGGQRR